MEQKQATGQVQKAIISKTYLQEAETVKNLENLLSHSPGLNLSLLT
jgi:hypothetical protein